MRHLDLFSGIGGFALAAEDAFGEVEHIFCDNDPFSQAVLRKHWPDALIYNDIKNLTYADIKKESGWDGVDLLTGGFPCQPFSAAGQRRGTEDDRHLWPEMLRVIRETSPRWVIGENVGGLLTWNEGMVLEGVLTDLEALGYEAWPFVLPACSQNAPHRRNRVWIVAHSNGRADGRKARSNAGKGASKRIRQRDAVGKSGLADSVRVPTDTSSGRVGGRRSKKYPARKGHMVPRKQGRDATRSKDERRDWNAWHAPVARLCTLDDGLPGGLVRPRGWRNAALKGAGNAIVPQVAASIMRAIVDL